MKRTIDNGDCDDDDDDAMRWVSEYQTSLRHNTNASELVYAKQNANDEVAVNTMEIPMSNALDNDDSNFRNVLYGAYQ